MNFSSGISIENAGSGLGNGNVLVGHDCGGTEEEGQTHNEGMVGHQDRDGNRLYTADGMT